jgi:hypothetical protein
MESSLTQPLFPLLKGEILKKLSLVPDKQCKIPRRIKWGKEILKNFLTKFLTTERGIMNNAPRFRIKRKIMSA